MGGRSSRVRAHIDRWHATTPMHAGGSAGGSEATHRSLSGIPHVTPVRASSGILQGMHACIPSPVWRSVVAGQLAATCFTAAHMISPPPCAACCAARPPTPRSCRGGGKGNTQGSAFRLIDSLNKRKPTAPTRCPRGGPAGGGVVVATPARQAAAAAAAALCLPALQVWQRHQVLFRALGAAAGQGRRLGAREGPIRGSGCLLLQRVLNDGRLPRGATAAAAAGLGFGDRSAADTAYKSCRLNRAWPTCTGRVGRSAAAAQCCCAPRCCLQAVATDSSRLSTRYERRQLHSGAHGTRLLSAPSHLPDHQHPGRQAGSHLPNTHQRAAARGRASGHPVAGPQTRLPKAGQDAAGGNEVKGEPSVAWSRGCWAATAAAAHTHAHQ